MAYLYVDEDSCSGCGSCLDVCTTGAISLVGQVAIINMDACRACQSCIGVCPQGAIREADMSIYPLEMSELES